MAAFTVGGVVFLGAIAVISIIGAVKGGVLLESIGEIIGDVLVVVAQYALALAVIVYIIGRMINAW